MPDAHRLSEWHLTSEAITAPRLSGLRGIALSTVVVACALVPRLWLHGVLEDRSTFILFTLAVMVSVRFGGDWPARSQRGSAYCLELSSFSVPQTTPPKGYWMVLRFFCLPL